MEVGILRDRFQTHRPGDRASSVGHPLLAPPFLCLPEIVNSKAGQKPQHLEMLLTLCSQQMGNGSCHPQVSGNVGMMESHQLFMGNLSTKCWLLQGRDGRKFNSIFVADSCTCLAWLCLFQGAKGRVLCPHTRTRSGNASSIPAPGFAECETSCPEQDKRRAADVCRMPWALCKTSCCPLLCKVAGTNTAHQGGCRAKCPISASGTSFRMEELSILQSQSLNCWLG